MDINRAKQIIADMDAHKIIWDDNLRAQANNTISNDPGNAVQRLIKTATDTYQKQVDTYNQKYKEFNQNNPFVFDDVLKQEQDKVKQRVDPYYQQTLSDFMQGVTTQRQRGAQDQQTLLTNLQQDTDKYQGEQKQQLLDALDQSRSGYASNGLYDSGARMRDQGTLEANTNQNLSNSLTAQDRRTNQITTAGDRQNQDLNLQTSQKQRDLTQQETYDVQSQGLTGVQQRQNQRAFEQGQYTGAAPGVDPLQYQNSLYSALQ